jgi:hypothetical protein
VGATPEGDGFDQMNQLCQISGVHIPKNLSGLRTKQERHTGVIAKEDMLNFVMGI